jgi:hypothetical protein
MGYSYDRRSRSAAGEIKSKTVLECYEDMIVIDRNLKALTEKLNREDTRLKEDLGTPTGHDHPMTILDKAMGKMWEAHDALSAATKALGMASQRFEW